jgi:DNA integrity scanning protein DisA with diadenylate cyclase activity
MAQSVTKHDASENRESRALIESAFGLARSLGIDKLLVQAGEDPDVRVVNRIREREHLIWLTPEAADKPARFEKRDARVIIPGTQLTRMDQIMFGLFMAVLQEELAFEESVVCLSGVAGSRRLDTLLVACPERDFPAFASSGMKRARKIVARRVFAQTLDIALRFAAEGREGRPIGTIFAIGEHKQLSGRVRQLIANPMRGHPASRRSVFAPGFVESLRQFSALDGAFVVNTKGTVEAAGAYLDAPTSKVSLPPGLGSRHAAAAAITAVTTAAAITISESSGTVTVFHDGDVIMKFDSPTRVAGPVPPQQE